MHILKTSRAALLAAALLAFPATQARAQQRMQGTRQMHVACVGPDSTRSFQRGVGVRGYMPVGASTDTTATGTRAITGGTQRSHEYPEYDVVLDVPNLCVERIYLKVDSLTARLNLNAQVANLVHVAAGADVLIGNVDLTIQDVRARALLLVDLDDVVHIVDQTLTFVDNHPEVVQQLGSTLQNTGAAVGGLVGDVVSGVRGLLLGTTNLAGGNVLQRIVNDATGEILERTLSSAGKTLTQKVVGKITDLPQVSQTTNAAGQLVRQVRDTTGRVIEYVQDAAGKLSGIRVLP